MENKVILVWKSKTERDSYRITWETDNSFVASFKDIEGNWVDTQPSYTAKEAIGWITDGDVKKDVLVV